MPPSSRSSTLERTVRLYPWYAALLNAHFWMPVFFLYFLQHMPMASVLRLEGIYYLAVVVLEVPSGYFSDRFGRRPTLLIANACLLAAYLLFFFGDDFAWFAGAQVLLAAGLAFNSGTDTSLHYDALASLGRADEFGAREAVVARSGFFASGVAGLAGGAVGLLALQYAYGLSALAALAALAVVAMMGEPTSHEKTLSEPAGPVAQLRTCGGLLRNRLLRWVFAYFMVMTVLNHIPYEFYQPYLALVLSDEASGDRLTPLAAGMHMGAVMVIASWFASRSVRWRDRAGLGGALLSATALQGVIILVMGLVLHPLVVVLLLARSVPRALMTAPINAAVAPRVGRSQRATFLSLQSLAGRLSFSGYLLVLSLLPVPTGDGDGAGMAIRLLVSAAFSAVALLVLALTWRSAREALRGSGDAAKLDAGAS